MPSLVNADPAKVKPGYANFAIDEPPLKLVLLMPVFDDWPCARLMIGQLDAALASLPVAARVLLVDDGSPSPPAAPLMETPLKNLRGIERLVLRRNLGSQRAIAIGLTFLATERDCDAVLVLDADGEDSPEDVPRLVQKFLELNGTHAVFAERTDAGGDAARGEQHDVGRMNRAFALGDAALDLRAREHIV